jgi:dTDP-4-dehydrorhamnose 3,5-epimerase
MNKIETGFKDLVVLEPRLFHDDRGYFYESYSKDKLSSLGLDYDFVQDNESKSTYGVLRGLHMQSGEYSQSKLVKVIKGEVLDVAVDLRKDSSTYGQWYSVNLSETNKKQLLIPRGFAHGFVVLSKEAIFSYKVDNVYNKESELSLNPFDETLNIDWGLEVDRLLLSEKDKEGLSLQLIKTRLL